MDANDSLLLRKKLPARQTDYGGDHAELVRRDEMANDVYAAIRAAGGSGCGVIYRLLQYCVRLENGRIVAQDQHGTIRCHPDGRVVTLEDLLGEWRQDPRERNCFGFRKVVMKPGDPGWPKEGFAPHLSDEVWLKSKATSEPLTRTPPPVEPRERTIRRRRSLG
jgi:hypothetical protein